VPALLVFLVLKFGLQKEISYGFTPRKADVRGQRLDASEGCALRKAEVRGQRVEVSEGCALARETI
jgi:hypothetical protein